MVRRSRDIDRITRTLRHFAAMPFLDRLELAAIAVQSRGGAYDAIAELNREGLVESIKHATDLMKSTRRFYLTQDGVDWLSYYDELTLDDLYRRYPVSSHWQRILLERLDAVGTIYRVASSVAYCASPIQLRWYRALPLDAGITLHDGRTIGVIRQGATSDRTSFAKRVWREERTEVFVPSLLLYIVPDDMRFQQTRDLLTRLSQPAVVALEKEAVLSSADYKAWHHPRLSGSRNMDSLISTLEGLGRLPVEPPLSRPSLSKSLDADDTGFGVPDHLLPSVLKPAEKRVLDVLADWPCITSKDLSGLLGVSSARTAELTASLISANLVTRVKMNGRNRLALTDWGLSVLARRDRTSVGIARKRWSLFPRDPKGPLTWQNISGKRSRQLARNMEHTEAVHWFNAYLAKQARALNYRIVQFDPPHRATRYFHHEGKLRSVHPDAFGILQKEQSRFMFFLEWENRAVRPVTMAARLAPYLRYYSSLWRPRDDHRGLPIVLIVFNDTTVESRFLGVARDLMDQTRVDVPLWVSNSESVEREGPMGEAWRSPDTLEPTAIFGRQVHE